MAFLASLHVSLSTRPYQELFAPQRLSQEILGAVSVVSFPESSIISFFRLNSTMSHLTFDSLSIAMRKKVLLRKRKCLLASCCNLKRGLRDIVAWRAFRNIQVSARRSKKTTKWRRIMAIVVLQWFVSFASFAYDESTRGALYTSHGTVDEFLRRVEKNPDVSLIPLSDFRVIVSELPHVCFPGPPLTMPVGDEYISPSSVAQMCDGTYHGLESSSWESLRKNIESSSRTCRNADVVFMPFFPACLIRALPVLRKTSHPRLVFPDLTITQTIADNFLGVLNPPRGKTLVFAVAQGFGRHLIHGKSASALVNAFNDSVMWTANGELNDTGFNIGKDIVVPALVPLRWRQPLPEIGDRKILVSFSGKVELDFYRHSRGTRQALYRYTVLSGDPRIVFRNTAGEKRWRNMQKIMYQSKFCLALEGWWSWTPRVSEAVIAGCVPVVLSSSQVPPLSLFVSFDRYGVFLHPRDMFRVADILEEFVRSGRYLKLFEGVQRVRDLYDWHKFGSLSALVEMQLQRRTKMSTYSIPQFAQNRLTAYKETPIGTHYQSMLSSSSDDIVDLSSDASVEELSKLTVCIDNFMKHDVENVIDKYLREFPTTVDQVVVVSNGKSNVPPRLGLTRVGGAEQLGPRGFLIQCWRLAKS